MRVPGKKYLYKRVSRAQEKLGIRKYHWYDWEGYYVDDAVAIIEEMSRYKDFRDPDRAVIQLITAHKDLEDAIPVAYAARVLGYPDPVFRKGTYFKNGAKELPFGHHPRLRFYPWIRQVLARQSDIEELYNGSITERSL